jgi:hypothetical protein
LLRANSPIRICLGDAGVAFLEWALAAYERLLPHAETDRWIEIPPAPTSSVWASPSRTAIRITIAIGTTSRAGCRSLQTTVRRRNVPVAASRKRRALDTREHDICSRIANQTSTVLAAPIEGRNEASLRSIRGAFDEQVISEHLAQHHRLRLDLGEVFGAVHRLKTRPCLSHRTIRLQEI